MNTLFVHIPKTGGTTVRTVLNLRNVSTVDSILKEGQLCFGHSTIRMIKTYVSKEFYNDAFKFTFVRNPYSRILSCYAFIFYRVMGEGLKFNEKTFLHFIKHELYTHSLITLPQTHFVSKENISELDFIGRYENFEDDLLYVAEQTDIKVDEIPIINQSKTYNKYQKLDWENYYCDEAYDIIREEYKEDFEVLDYD